MPKEAKKEEELEVKKKRSLPKTLLVLGGVVVLLVLTAVSIYFFLQYQSAQKQLTGTATNDEVKGITEKVGKLIELPTGEEVTLATVSDINKLKDQVFFARAQNGDKVLIYAKAGKAILYRPSTNKIIEVGPVNLAEGTKEASPTPSTVRVALYNGTKTTGLTRSAETTLNQLSSLKIEVTAKENASSSAYIDSIVVDLTGTNKQAADQLATFAKGKVGTLPTNETKPENADILIILGQSYKE